MHEARYSTLLLTGAMVRGVCALESSSCVCLSLSLSLSFPLPPSLSYPLSLSLTLTLTPHHLPEPYCPPILAGVVAVVHTSFLLLALAQAVDLLCLPLSEETAQCSEDLHAHVCMYINTLTNIHSKWKTSLQS